MTSAEESRRRLGPSLQALVIAFLGMAMVFLGYGLGAVPLNVDEVVGPAIFWGAVVFFFLAVPFRDAARVFSRSIRTALGMGAFALYTAIHLLLYGFVFEAIVASIYGAGPFAVNSGFLIDTNLFAPLSPASLAFDLAYNPVILMTAPPIFSAALSFYSISVAFVIAVLVVANIGVTRELGALATATGRARSLVVLPALGIVLGASCCLSVAGLVSLASPTTSILASSPWVYYVTYFFFPCIAMLLLYANLRATRRISSGISSPS